jgi:myo-inositol-1(or 4)-monophosphatase
VDNLLELAIAAARSAGAILSERYGHPGRITMKPGGAGPVSDADLASEAAILARLRETSIPILSEESGGAGSGRRWIVDPLDGTGNFIRHLPWFGVGIALATDDTVELGVVYAPITDELFAAARGEGATLNGKRLRVSETASLVQSCVATSIDQGMCAVPARIRRFARVARQVGEMRSPNAALVDLAYVAAGRTDGFWEDGLSPWDIAAGSVLVSEAGGATSCLDGTPLRLHHRGVVATNRRIHAELTAVLRE